MGNYNWSINSIKSLLSILKKMEKEEKDASKLLLIKKDITYIKEFISEYYNPPFESNLDLFEKFKLDKNTLMKMPFLWDDFIRFNKITELYSSSYIPKTLELTNDDLLTITHDFYSKSLNNEFYNQFIKNFNKRKNHITFDDCKDEPYSGMTIIIPSLNESFTKIKRTNTISDVITTIHEYSHSTCSLINPYNYTKEKILYCEIESEFMELIATDYLETIFKNGEAKLYRTSIHNDFKKHAEVLVNKINLIRYESTIINGYSSYEQLENLAYKKCNLFPEELEDIINYKEMIPEIYLTGYLFALELYNLYKKDKDKALDFFKRIILLDCKTEEKYYNSIKSFGLIPTKSVSEFQKKLEKNNRKN